MEQINQTAKDQLSPDSIINQITKIGTGEGKNLNLLLANPDGFNALDIIGERITTDDLLKAENLIKINYGVDYPLEKLNVLWDMIREENWTKERLQRTVKWFLKTKKFPNWTIADWFDYEVKLYPYSWYLDQLNKGYKDDDMCAYKINGKVFWKFKDNNELPFEKIAREAIPVNEQKPSNFWNPKEDEHFQQLKKRCIATKEYNGNN